MIEEAEVYIREALAGRRSGADESCDYYPCHREGQDCTWCFCPFYPCGDGRTGGKTVTSERTGKPVWSCIDCTWVHEDEVAGKVLEELEKLGEMEGWGEDALKTMRSRLLRDLYMK
ncbi:MAG: hypothetical protein GXO65_00575 [Euryarchaeota archaeon]|nr:hypothetical protein [Euryarchaeota archaeon]